MNNVNVSVFSPIARQNLVEVNHINTFDKDITLTFTATESSTQFYITKGWSVAAVTPLESITLDYLYIQEHESQQMEINCEVLNSTITYLLNTGVNMADSNTARSFLNHSFKRNLSYAAYQQAITSCTNTPGVNTLAEGGVEFEEIKATYRYAGAGGQEKDDEIFIGAYTAEYWEYDSRLGRRWNVDPVVRPYESPYVCFRNNPIFYIDFNGANPGDPKEHKVKEGDNLTKISKKYGVSIADLARMNNIKDINLIKVGQVLKVNPEVEFSNSPLTDYNNPNNRSYEEVNNMEQISFVAVDFIAGEGAENTIISGGNALRQVQELATIKSLINEGLSFLGKDGKFIPGEVFMSNYYIGNLSGENGKRIIKESLLNFFNPFTFNPFNNAAFSAENVLGSYGFSMRVNADGKTLTIAVYDSKTIESLTDRLFNTTNRQRTAEASVMCSDTYQRYIWSAPIQGK